jgi:hypothetical protein
VSKTVLTQFGGALKQLGIEHIAAYSPQARGRSERAFETLQDRLPKELRLAGIDRHGRSGQPLDQRELYRGVQPAVRDRRGAGGFGIRGG